MDVEENSFVMPGEKIAMEEEIGAGNNTYVENGFIYSSIFGRVSKGEGAVNVAASAREIKIIDKYMLVMGTVTDDMKSVSFVKLSDINVERRDYLALKDGKIVAPKPRGPPRFGDRRGGAGGDRNGRENRFSSGKPPKMCGIGDTILARVQFNDKDAYTLSLFGRETGVIYATCERCGGELEVKEENMLVCKECMHREHRKISEYYNKPSEIKKLFA